MKTLKKILVAVVLIGIVGTGIVEASPPTVVLKSPKAGIAKNAMVSFKGGAVDVEDGKLNDVLVWSSDIQGYLGFGPKIKIKLWPGLHTITLSVTDSEGYNSKAFVKIRILGDEEIESGIELTSVPGYGKPGKVLGRVYGVSYKDYFVAAYFKSYAEYFFGKYARYRSPIVVAKISKNNSFSLKTPKIDKDFYIFRIAVLLIPKGSHLPLVYGSELSDSLLNTFSHDIYDRICEPNDICEPYERFDPCESDEFEDPCEFEETGEVGIRFTYVPFLYTRNYLEGKVWGVNPDDYDVAVYIRVIGKWWQKPTWNSPVTSIDEDSTWRCRIVTGGVDDTAYRIKAFLIPKDYIPPMNMSEIDLSKVVAEVSVER